MFDWIYSFSQAFAAWCVAIIGQVLGWLLAFFFDVLVWLLDLLGPIIRRFFMALALGFGDLINNIPVPSYILALRDQWNSLPMDSLAYFLSAFNVPYGLTVLTSAAVVRWSLRVIPIVGRMFRG